MTSIGASSTSRCPGTGRRSPPRPARGCPVSSTSTCDATTGPVQRAATSSEQSVALASGRAEGGRVSKPYQQGHRRMLLDMHIPDWDPRFLSEYDPVTMAARVESAGVDAVMLYCKSHTGLCNWPTPVGQPHRNLGGRDVVGEMVAELDRRGIGTCAYYSVVYDNWAAEQHPEWRHVPVQTLAGGTFHFLSPRYGTCCPNNPEYLAYELPIVDDLLGRH